MDRIVSARSSGSALTHLAGIHLAVNLDSLDRSEIERLQKDNLHAMLRAARQVPGLRRRLPSLGSVRDAMDLAELPLLTPAGLAAACPPHTDDLLLDPGAPGHVLRSSGTAGRPKVVYHSWISNSRVRHLGARGVRAGLDTLPQRMANCMFAGELSGAFLFVEYLAEDLSAQVFPLGSGVAPQEAAQIIAEHDVDTLVATPAYGVELMASADARRNLPLRSFLFLGEAVGPERERVIGAIMPELTVRSLAYSTSETGPVGYQCRFQRGTRHHLHEDAVIVEVVDEKGRRVPDGSVGEVVVTPLQASGMALFRYRLGDCGYLTVQPCGCGSAVRSLELLGRSTQSVTVDGSTISTEQLMSCLAVLGVTDAAVCQLQFLWHGDGYDVRLLLSPGTPDGISADAVLRAVRGTHQLHRVLTSRRCRGLRVVRATPQDFARTKQGKVPALYQKLTDAASGGNAS
jgi:phenylacetate-CoA ligase